MYKFCCLVLLATTIGCDHPLTSQKKLYAEPTTKEACYKLFTDILEVQKMRDIVREDFNITLQDYSEDKTSQVLFNKEREAWTQREAELRKRVTAMYDAGYENGCFDDTYIRNEE